MNNHQEIFHNHETDYVKIIEELDKLVKDDPSYGVKGIYEDPENHNFIIIERENRSTHLPKWPKIPIDYGADFVKIKDYILQNLEENKPTVKNCDKSAAA